MIDKDMGKKTVIIPDIHTNFVDAEIIIEKEKPDKVVFLGDYFDDFDDTLEITEQTALWLKDSLEKPGRVHLLGNHDLSYINTSYRCSGFSEGKLYAIKKSGVDLTKLKHFAWVDHWLCTHAGLSDTFYKMQGEHVAIENLLDVYPKDYTSKLYDCSYFRGGSDPASGILWCDYSEFVDIPYLKQIFGHTKANHVRQTENHICLDTGLHHYAVYKNNKMKVKTYDTSK